jgi:hypothetical protein
MFWRRDKTEMDVKDVFGLEIAKEFRRSKLHDPVMHNSILTALKMIFIIPKNKDHITPIIREEIIRLIKDQRTSANGSGSLVVAVGAGYNSYRNWGMARVPFRALNDRIGFVPAGWRMEALSGLRYWIASLTGEPVPIKAYMADIFTLSATMAWDASIKIESIIGKYVVGLPYSLQAIVIEAMVEGIIKDAAQISATLQKAAEAAVEGYANGMPLKIWSNIVDWSNTTYNYYDALAILSKGHGIMGISELGVDIENAVDTHLDIETELKLLRENATEFGIKYNLLRSQESFDDLLEHHSYILSSISTA